MSLFKYKNIGYVNENKIIYESINILVGKYNDYINYCGLLTVGFMLMILFIIMKVEKYDKKKQVSY